MLLLRIFVTLCFTIATSISGASEYGPLYGYDRPGNLQGAMNTYGLDTKLASILDKYYRNNFTGEQEWSELKSIRYEGTLHLEDGEFRLSAFKKKPHYCKFTIVASNGGSIEMGYDGEDSWQRNTSVADSFLTAMPEAEASNFIRDATIGGHLLFPLIEGKEIELLGASVVGESRCYEIQVTLPDGQIIRSFIDISNFTERRRITINQVSGLEEVISYSDFRKIGSILIPFHSILTRDGAQVHEIHISKANTNRGTTNWMFARPKSNADFSAEPDIPTIDMPLNITFGNSFGVSSFFDMNSADY